MRVIVIFLTGIAVGLAVQSALAQKRTEMYVNHVGIAVPSVPAAIAYYTGKLGGREARCHSGELRQIGKRLLLGRGRSCEQSKSKSH